MNNRQLSTSTKENEIPSILEVSIEENKMNKNRNTGRKFKKISYYEYSEVLQSDFMEPGYIYTTRENKASFKRKDPTFEEMRIFYNNQGNIKENIFFTTGVKTYGMCNLMNLEYTISTIYELVKPQSGGEYYKKTFNRPMGKAKEKERFGSSEYIGKKMSNELSNSEKKLNSGYLFSGNEKINGINCQVFLKVKASGENAKEYTLEEIILIPFNKEICLYNNNKQQQQQQQKKFCYKKKEQIFYLSPEKIVRIFSIFNKTLEHLGNNYPYVQKYLIELFKATFFLLGHNRYSLEEYLKKKTIEEKQLINTILISMLNEIINSINERKDLIPNKREELKYNASKEFAKSSKYLFN